MYLLSHKVDRALFLRCGWPLTDKDLTQSRIVWLQCNPGRPHAFQLRQVEGDNQLEALLRRLGFRHGGEQIRATQSRAITLKQRSGLQDACWEAHLNTSMYIVHTRPQPNCTICFSNAISLQGGQWGFQYYRPHPHKTANYRPIFIFLNCSRLPCKILCYVIQLRRII